SLIAERGLLMEAQLLEIVAELMNTSSRSVIPIADVTQGLISRYGAEYERPITNRWIGGILRKNLNLRTYKSHGIYVLPVSEREKIELMCERYGVNSAMHSGEGDVGTSGTG